MAYPAQITALLTADATLTALLTGGIHAFESLPRNGVKELSAAWANGRMKPLAVVKGRSHVPFGGIKDTQTQFTTSRQIVEIWLYNDGDQKYTTLRSAQDRIFTLLHLKRIAGAYQIRYVSDLIAPDPVLNNAATIRLEYAVIGHL